MFALGMSLILGLGAIKLCHNHQSMIEVASANKLKLSDLLHMIQST